MASDPTIPSNSTAQKKKVFIVFPAISERTADYLYWAGNILVIIAGLAGLIGAVGVIWGDRVRDHFNDQRLSENELKTATAERDAAIANKAAAEANLRAAEANGKAEKERTERLKLEEKLAPRTLTPSQQEELQVALRPFAPGEVDTFRCGGHPREFEFQTLLSNVIGRAGFSIRSYEVMGGVIVQGVVVESRPGWDSPVPKMIVDMLTSFGIDAVLKSFSNWNGLPSLSMIHGPPWQERDPAPIRLWVGPKIW